MLDLALPEYFITGWRILTELNFLLFILVMFRLKTLQLYMDSVITTEEELNNSLTQLKFIRRAFLIF